MDSERERGITITMGGAIRRSKRTTRMYLELPGNEPEFIQPDVGWYPNEDTSFKVRLRGRATGELLPYNMREPGISYEMANLVSRDCRNGKPKDPRNNSYRSGNKKGR